MTPRSSAAASEGRGERSDSCSGLRCSGKGTTQDSNSAMAHLQIRGGQQDLKPKAELSGKKWVAHSLCSLVRLRSHYQPLSRGLVVDRTGVTTGNQGNRPGKSLPRTAHHRKAIAQHLHAC